MKNQNPVTLNLTRKVIITLFLLLAVTLFHQSPASADSGAGQISGQINFEFDALNLVPLPCSTVTLTPQPDIDLGQGLGQPITQITSADGQYNFVNLPSSTSTDYTLEVTSPFEWTQYSTSPDGDFDNTVQYALTDTANQYLNQDFIGYIPIFTVLGSIGDRVWEDVDFDGDDVLDGPDIPLSGVGIKLTPAANIDLGNGLGQPIFDTTDQDGFYLFVDLPYQIYNLDLPDGCDDPFFDPYRGEYQYEIEIDMSTLPLSPFVTYDRDGVLDGITTTTLDAADNLNDLDIDFGFAFPIFPVLGMIQGTVYSDNDLSMDYSGSDTPYECTIVRLIPPLDVDLGLGLGQPISQFTDSMGNYEFIDLPVDNITYEIEVGTPNIYDHPFSDPFNIPHLSQDDPSATSSITIDLASPNQIKDFGYEALAFPTVSVITGSLWGDVDGDGDGMMDAGDQPLNDVSVMLIPEADIDLGAGAGVPISDMTEDGDYYFEGVPYLQSAGPSYPSCITPPDPVYTVQVDTLSLPVEFGPDTTFEPDGDNDASWTTTQALSDYNQIGNFSFAQNTVTSINLSDSGTQSAFSIVLVLLLTATLLLFASYRLLYPRKVLTPQE